MSLNINLDVNASSTSATVITTSTSSATKFIPRTTFLDNFSDTLIVYGNEVTSVSNSNTYSSSDFSSSFFDDFARVNTTTLVLDPVLNATKTNATSSENSYQNSIIIPLYAVIFGCCVIGNLLVILTLAQNKRMRTVTNVYLLNLAISDLLLGVFCMPFTLVGQILRNFVFGKIMCKLIPYFQASSVSVAVWTLVAISLERYFAICRPLSSRRWQTRSHAYKMIGVVWFLSLLSNSPLVFVQQLQPMKNTASEAMKCREVWPSRSSERTYVIFLDIALLLIPLLSMGIAYSLIVSKLWRGLRREMKHTTSKSFHLQEQSPSLLNNENGLLIHNGTLSEPLTCTTSLNLPNKTNNRVMQSTQYLNQYNGASGKQSSSVFVGRKSKFSNSTRYQKTSATHFLQQQQQQQNQKKDTVKLWLLKGFTTTKPLKSALKPTNPSQVNYSSSQNKVRMATDVSITESEMCDAAPEAKDEPSTEPRLRRQAIRSNYMDKSIEAKKKVIRMLFVIIVEFFVCWAPLHILNTVYLYSPAFVYSYFNNTGIALIQLMAYISSCCNPITYCFMNRRFRAAFLAIVNSYKCSSCIRCNADAGDNECAQSQMYSLNNRNFMPVPCNSDASNNSNSGIFAGRNSGLQRSELLVLNDEDRIIETDPSDASFRFRITWSKHCSVRYNCSKSSKNGSSNNGVNGKLLTINGNGVSGCENERYS
ncbi:neuropeptide SIFamide receptor-like [Culicoides brevitarsis]|uniref:neuropeptide SIFamide receptor-like n=1 Tax=Culicoides brevitarsis TaxID=469753 RepID=UPI00307B9886